MQSAFGLLIIALNSVRMGFETIIYRAASKSAVEGAPTASAYTAGAWVEGAGGGLTLPGLA
jgi:hypothetical protein